MVIGNFPAGLQIIRAAQPEVQLHILALQRLVEQLAVPAADVLRGGVGDVFLMRLPFHIVAIGIHIRNELLLRAALLHSLFDMIRQSPLPRRDAEWVGLGLRDGQAVLPTELAAVFLDLLHLPCGLMEFHARLEIDGVHDDMIMDVGSVHVGDHDALVALKMLRQLHPQLVCRCEVQWIIRCERLHDVVVAAALRFAELLFHCLEFRHRRPRYTVDAADKLLHRLFPVGDIVDDAPQPTRDSNEFNVCHVFSYTSMNGSMLTSST